MLFPHICNVFVPIQLGEGYTIHMTEGKRLEIDVDFIVHCQKDVRMKDAHHEYIPIPGYVRYSLCYFPLPYS